MESVRRTQARHARSQVACGSCALRDFCVADAIHQPGPPALGSRRIRSGDTLFARNDPQRSLYAVRAGFLKQAAVMADGERRILSLHIMGDVIGLDALGSGLHPTEAVALNDCEVCELPIGRAEQLMDGRPVTAARLRILLSEHIAQSGDRMVTLAWLTAKQRVAGFLLQLGGRWARRGYSPSEFDLCFTRKEMGSYLGLTFETVSRTLSFFAARGWIALRGREVRICDRAALELQERTPA
jgi:CRP/FNR family transcriptional regulator, anaerobic regulatory protein